MRINKYVAHATGLSRRAADTAVAELRINVNGQLATAGHDVAPSDTVTLDGKTLTLPIETVTIALNKPVGYVVSRNGQGSKTIYDLLPPKLHHLKPIGRLDKDSSGLLLLTDDGQLSQDLTHPSRQKRKVYDITLDKPLQPLHQQVIAERGLQLEDGLSKLGLERAIENDNTQWTVTMYEGRNRQIRRTFAALGYEVTRLHRTIFGKYALDDLQPGKWEKL